VLVTLILAFETKASLWVEVETDERFEIQYEVAQIVKVLDLATVVQLLLYTLSEP